jgi:spore coat protein U-like protein
VTGRLLRTLLLGWLLAGGQAWAGLVGCSLSAAPAILTDAYDPVTNPDVTGAFNISCTRTAGPHKFTLWLGLNQVVGETLDKPAPFADTLNYGVYRTAGATDLWTSGNAALAGAGAGALQIDLDFGGGGTLGISFSVPVLLRIPTGQTLKSAGTYTDTLTATLRETNSVGTFLSTTGLTLEGTIPNNCTFGGAAVTISLNYQAFRSSNLVDTTGSVPVTCSRGTYYTLTLDTGVGVVPNIELTYGIVFTSTGTTSVASTSSSGAAPSAWGLTVTVPAGQAGTCTVLPCSGTSRRTITVAY